MLAQDLIELDEAPRQVRPFSERYPGLTANEGYAAAHELHAHRIARGWKPVGRKIGFTNRTIWERYGVHEPIWGMVYDRTLVPPNTPVSLRALAQPRIEPEILFKLKSAPRTSAEHELLSCIEWMAHSVEIVQCHHPEWKVTLADCTADNGLHGRLIVGPGFPLEHPDELPKIEARLYKGSQLVDRGVGANVLGSPLVALGYLVGLLAKQPEAPPLRAGEIISTGVLTDAHPVAPGEVWRTEVTGLQGLTLVFE